MIKVPTHDINPLFSASSINNRYTCMWYVLALLLVAMPSSLAYHGEQLFLPSPRGREKAMRHSFACCIACVCHVDVVSYQVPISRLRVWGAPGASPWPNGIQWHRVRYQLAVGRPSACTPLVGLLLVHVHFGGNDCESSCDRSLSFCDNVLSSCTTNIFLLLHGVPVLKYKYSYT